MSVKDLVTTARTTGDFNALVQRVPFLVFLGLKVEERNGQLLARLPPSPHLIGNPALPALHGGAIGGLLESVAHLEVLRRAESVVLPKTITLTVDFLRSGKPLETLVLATVVKHGRRVASVHVRAWQEDEAAPIATATVHLLVMPEST